MSSFTRDADRDRALVRCATRKVPAWRSNTAMPASTPAGTTTAAGDGDGRADGAGGGADVTGIDGDGDDGADQTVTGAGSWQPASVVPSSAAANQRPTRIPARPLSAAPSAPAGFLSRCR